MEHTPPPFFKTGPSAQLRLAAFALLAIFFMVADARLAYLAQIRQVVAIILYPLQQAARSPLLLAQRAGEFFATQERLQTENDQLRQQQLQQAVQLQRLQALELENTQLRGLLDARGQLSSPTRSAEILYRQRDPFTLKVIIDRGLLHGIEPGQVAVDAVGVVGQVTRAYPFTAEVTLITDKSQSVPVQVLRSGKRAILFGAGRENTLDLPFMPLSTDIQNGDVLVTSGIDGTYPPGLPVAVVSNIERNAAYPFARITSTPTAGVDRHRHLLVLTPPPRPAELAEPQSEPAKKTKGKEDRR